jgi:hypothetical protein
MKRAFTILAIVCVARFAGAQPVEPPLPPSPIAAFREWLKQSPEQRTVALAKRSEQSRKAIEGKLRDYSALSPEERERRLNATELQWYVTQLLQLPKQNRALAAQQAPVLWQPMILERLAAWDKLSPELQKEALEHRTVMEYLSAPADQQSTFLKTLSLQDRDSLVRRIDRWKTLPAVEREKLDQRVDEFFRMQPDKQQQTLNSFSESERQNMNQTLQAFRALSPEQRDLCVRSFSQFAEKFGAMDRTNQIAFLRNAERWQEMSQKDRDMWRKIVAVVPPMPPLPIDFPPMPRAPRAGETIPQPAQPR